MIVSCHDMIAKAIVDRKASRVIMILRIIISIISCSLMMGCQTSQTYQPTTWEGEQSSNQSASAWSGGPATSGGGSGTASISPTDLINYHAYNNAQDFDLVMTKSLKQGFREVTVVVNAEYDANKPPQIAARWLGAVEHYGGSVVVRQDPKYSNKTKALAGALVGLLELVVVVGNNLMKEKADFSTASEYNAVIHYRPADFSRKIMNEQITTIVFRSKSEPL